MHLKKIFFLVLIINLFFGAFNLSLVEAKVGDSLPDMGVEPTSFVSWVKYIYLLMLAFIGLAAFGVLVYAGFLWMLADTVTAKEDAKKWLSSAISGLVLALAAYLILNTINPNLVNWDLSNLGEDVTPAPTKPKPLSVSISANPNPTSSEGNFTLFWNSANAKSCTGSNAWTGDKPTKGEKLIRGITETKTYVLTCQDAKGNEKSVKVTVVPGDQDELSVSIHANPVIVESGETSLVTWESTGAESCDGVIAGQNFDKVGLKGEYTTTALTEDASATVVCWDKAGNQKSASVKIFVGDPNELLVHIGLAEGYSNPIDYNTNVVLEWETKNAESCVGQVGEWKGEINPNGTYTTGKLKELTTFTITCKDKDGNEKSDSLIIEIKK